MGTLFNREVRDASGGAEIAPEMCENGRRSEKWMEFSGPNGPKIGGAEGFFGAQSALNLYQILKPSRPDRGT
jgi:hypothetical protein